MTYFFQWYTGAIWSNLLASLIWATPTLFVVMWRLKKHLRTHMAAHHESLAQHVTDELKRMLGVDDEEPGKE